MEPLFSDKVVKSKFLNDAILFINLTCAFFYRNIVGLRFTSTATRIAQEAFNQLIESERQRENQSKSFNDGQRIKGYDETGAELTSRRECRADAGSVASETHSLSGSLDSVQTSSDRLRSMDGARSLIEKIGFKRAYIFSNISVERLRLFTNVDRFDEQAESLRLRVPEVSRPWVLAVELLQVALIVRFALILFLMSPMNQRDVMLTSTRTLMGVDHNSKLPDLRELNLTLSEAELEQVYSNETCDFSGELFERYISHRFRDFITWNMSAEFERCEFVRRVILIEQQPSVQIHSRETRMVVFLMGFFLAACLALNFKYDKKPIDIAAMAFIYEPRFAAFQTHARLIYYLDMMRASYRNFWSTYGVSMEGSLVLNSASRSAPIGKRETEAQSSNVVDTVALNQAQFDTYMPHARSQDWRRVLVLAQPIFQLVAITLLATFLVGVFIFYVNLNSVVMRLNMEVKSVVAHESALPVGFPVKAQCRDEASLARIGALFRQLLLARLVAALEGRRSADVARPLTQEQRAQLAEAIQPVASPALLDWGVVTVGVCLVTSLVSLFFCLLTICIADICFWLIELRVKLHISVRILKRQQMFATVDRRSLGLGADPTDYQWAALTPAECTQPRDSMELGADWVLAAMSPHQPPRRQLDLARPPRPTARTQIPSTGGGDALRDEQLCNLSLRLLLNYLCSRRSVRSELADGHAQRLIRLDLSESVSRRRATNKFLTSTYLDFRIFQDEIDDCRMIINLFSLYAVFNSLHLIAGSLTMTDTRIQSGLLVAAFGVANFALVGASIFQSQCAKLHNPIYSMLAASTSGDKSVRHLALLWRRSLTDLAGSRSKFAFRIYSFTISYATTLQFNLSVASLFILTLDKTR